MFLGTKTDIMCVDGANDCFVLCRKDADYKRVAMASLVKAVYMLELDRQENRTQENALAPSWWMPLKYKLTHKLIDKRDGSIFGAIFEWDRSAALSDFIPIRPNGAPKAVLALRGTLLRSHTGRRDIEDDIRFAAWESLKGSFRFQETLEALISVSDMHGSRNVCIAGHSLGAGFALQVGKELAKEGINVEAHLFNPPSLSLAMNIGYIGEGAEYVWNGLKSMFVSSNEVQVSNDGHKTYGISVKRFMGQLSGMMDAYFGVGNRVPHLYINSNDYISCLYFYGTREITDSENMVPAEGKNVAKLFVVSKKNQEFLEAHGLKQWFSSDAELGQDIHNCKLISKQLSTLNIATPSLVIFLLYPHLASLAMSHINIRGTTDYLWNILKSVPLSSGKGQVSNDGDNTSGVGLKGWTSQLSRLKDASFWVVKCVSYLKVYKNGGTREKKIEEKKDLTDRQLRAKLLVVSKEKQEFLAAHGLEQWWPSDAELVQTIHDREHIRHLYSSTLWETAHLLNPSFVTLAMNLRNIGKAQVSNDGDNSGVGLKVGCLSYLA
ncbi:GDSL esterase/lipase At4g10955-like [Vigna unguiculata]|uniref:GDSL esterase/lipase At4g10955-like n=1 Tax=Vigna unguiculata TaxID=3917 RepID=UPI001016C374|nr:GDSL esterase/lipase At4g10955-like [Vigna unguiculata]